MRRQPLFATPIRRFIFLAYLAPIAFATSCVQTESDGGVYPDRAIEIIVPFAPGGGSDTFARILKAEVEEQKLLPQPLVIINAPGAGGTVGSRRAMNAAADGYTVLFLHDAILTAKFSGKALYGPEAFEQIAGTGRTGMVIAVHEDSPYENLNDLLEQAAEQPETVTFAANMGAPSHFAGLMLEQAHGSAQFRFAQIGGGADRFASIKGQHAQVTAFSLEEYLRFEPEGIKALAFLGRDRHWRLPNLATAVEQGVNVQHSVMQYWWMPKNTPEDRRLRFAAMLEKVMQSDRFIEKLTQMKVDPVYITGDDLAKHLAENEAALAKVDPGAESPLPNLPLTLMVLTAVFGAGAFFVRIRTNKPKKTDDNAADKPSLTSWFVAIAALCMVCFYALSMILWELPLGIATGLFVVLLGLALTLRDRLGNRWRSIAVLVVVACGLGGLFYVVFTRLFEIGL